MPWRGSIRREASRVLAGWMRTLLVHEPQHEDRPTGRGAAALLHAPHQRCVDISQDRPVHEWHYGSGAATSLLSGSLYKAGKIYISRFVDGAFVEPEQLQAPFDSDAYELAIVIAPDESYMLIGITRTGLEDKLYISYRETDGSWTERIRAPYQCGGFLALSPDGEYLFFLGEGIYWVDTSFVEELYPTSANGAG